MKYEIITSAPVHKKDKLIINKYDLIYYDLIGYKPKPARRIDVNVSITPAFKSIAPAFAP